jgi:ADP-heptose:LPS heptosyltransferase
LPEEHEMRALVVCNGGGIGDAFIATPVMRALRQRYAHVTALIGPAQAGVIADAAADEVWVDDGSFPRLLLRLREAKFDAAVVTWATARSAAALAWAEIPQRIGQAGRLYSPLFTTRVTPVSERGDHLTRWAQVLLEYARALGCDGDESPISPIDGAAREEAGRLLHDLRLTEKPFILFHPSRGITLLRELWPTSSMARLARALREHFALPILVTGSGADAASAAAIARRAAVDTIAGRTSLRGFAALAERAHLVVAMDSGPMHLAAAAGAPTVGIFAMRPDEPDRWSPIGPRTAIVRSAYPCPAWHTKERCPDFACVRDLDPARVVAVAAGLLSAEREAPV